MKEATGSGDICGGDFEGQQEVSGGCNGNGVTSLPVLKGPMRKEVQKPCCRNSSSHPQKQSRVLALPH